MAERCVDGRARPATHTRQILNLFSPFAFFPCLSRPPTRSRTPAGRGSRILAA